MTELRVTVIPSRRRYIIPSRTNIHTAYYMLSCFKLNQSLCITNVIYLTNLYLKVYKIILVGKYPQKLQLQNIGVTLMKFRHNLFEQSQIFFISML